MSDPILVIIRGKMPDEHHLATHRGLELMNCPSCPKTRSVKEATKLGALITDAECEEPLQVLLFPGLTEAEAWAADISQAVQQMTPQPRIIADEVSVHAFLDAQVQYIRTPEPPAVAVLAISPSTMDPLDLSQVGGAGGTLILNCPSCPRRTAVHTRCAGLILGDGGSHVQLVSFPDAIQALAWMAGQAVELVGRRVIPDLC